MQFSLFPLRWLTFLSDSFFVFFIIWRSVVQILYCDLKALKNKKLMWWKDSLACERWHAQAFPDSQHHMFCFPQWRRWPPAKSQCLSSPTAVMIPDIIQWSGTVFNGYFMIQRSDFDLIVIQQSNTCPSGYFDS